MGAKRLGDCEGIEHALHRTWRGQLGEFNHYAPFFSVLSFYATYGLLYSC